MTDVDPSLGTTVGPSEFDGTPLPAREPTGAQFEQRRALTAVRERLFGGTPHLYIGRYRIDRRLGAGGMGEVYLGFDPELARKVAIKRVLGSHVSSAQQRRLRAEARALAKLSHPNVVVIHEVGEHEGELFLAMEYVDGETLGGWLHTRRSWQEILHQFVAAGRGLAAAHAAGIVHRDFKPDNVLIGVDGRARVADFGLALADEHAVLTDRARVQAQSAAAGTFRFMPLEQLRGMAVDASCDQFAFCVALYEGLYAQPPFAVGNLAQRIEALELDEPLPPPRIGPRRLWTILRRGLRRDPQQRWPDLDSLLAALESVPSKRRRTLLVAAAMPLTAAFALTVRTISVVEYSTVGHTARLEPPPTSSSEASSNIETLTPDEVAAGISCVHDPAESDLISRCEILRELVIRLYAEQFAVLDSAAQARVIPAMRDGAVLGYKLYGVRANSVFALVGFEHGDLIERVNDFPPTAFQLDRVPGAVLERYVIEVRRAELLRRIELLVVDNFGQPPSASAAVQPNMFCIGGESTTRMCVK